MCLIMHFRERAGVGYWSVPYIVYYYGVSDTMIFEYHYGALSLPPLCSGTGITLVYTSIMWLCIPK